METHTGTVLQRVAGKDASKQFWKYHNEGILRKYKAQLQVGSLNTKKAAEPTPAPAAAPKKSAPVAQTTPTNYQPAATAEPLEPFGDLIPFADPSWYQGVSYCIATVNGWMAVVNVFLSFVVLIPLLQ